MEKTNRPWNVLMFFCDVRGVPTVEEFYVDTVPPYSHQEPPVLPTELIECNVLLIYHKNGHAQVDDIFRSHFLDPYHYARYLVNAGINGIITRASAHHLVPFMDVCKGIILQNIEAILLKQLYEKNA